MVSLIQSNFAGMGSGMTPGDLGFVLQNRGELFSLDPGHPNAFEPGAWKFRSSCAGAEEYSTPSSESTPEAPSLG